MDQVKKGKINRGEADLVVTTWRKNAATLDIQNFIGNNSTLIGWGNNQVGNNESGLFCQILIKKYFLECVWRQAKSRRRFW